MKQNKILLVMAAVAGLLILRKKSVAGVGAVNPYKAISELQRQGVDFTQPWFSQLDDASQLIIRNYGIRHGYKQPKASEKKQTYGESFYNSLKRIYAKAVSGVGGYYTAEELTDATEYPIFDKQDRVSLIYRDRSDFPMLRHLLETISAPVDDQSVRDANQAYWGCVAYIAGGGKFVWSDKKKKGLKEELFASRYDPKSERISRVKYLAKQVDGGTTIEELAELWSANGGDWDEARAGIAQAVLDTPSVGAAKEMLYQAAISMLEDVKGENERQDQEYDPFSEVPF